MWGTDLGAEWLIADRFSLAGTLSYVNKDFFPRSEVGGAEIGRLVMTRLQFTF